MRKLSLLILLLTGSVYGQSKVITVCTGFLGHIYVLPGGLVPPNASGWNIDSIKDGVLFFFDNHGAPSIIFKDASGQMMNPEESGGTVQYIPGTSSDHRLVLVNYAGRGAIELYLFDLDDEGEGTVLFYTIKSNNLISSSRLLVGKCAGG